VIEIRSRNYMQPEASSRRQSRCFIGGRGIQY
jgi:hypothetical protein